MRIILGLTAAATAAAVISVWPAQVAEEPLRTLVAAEREFARTAVQKGIRDSFLEFFADDSIALVPDAQSAKERLRRRPSRTFAEQELTWEPRTGNAAASGELGWLTGPSTFIDHSTTEGPPRYGNYLSIWRRQSGAPWRVYIDVGIMTPEPVPFDEGFVALQIAQPYRGRQGRDAATRSLAAADADLNSRIVRTSSASAYADSVAERGRIHRQGMMPVVGRRAIVSWLEAHAEKWSGTMTAAEAAASGELGYSYGVYTTNHAVVGPTFRSGERGAYVRVWARDAGGRWLIVADVNDPA